MELKQFYGKCVCICTVDGDKFTGLVEDWLDAEDNNIPEECIIIRTPCKETIEFSESTIESIEIAD